MDRNEINSVFLDSKGTPIYSEYMGPEYPGWDADRNTGCWDWIGNRIDCSPLTAGTPFENGVPWEITDGDIQLADALLLAAGYPLVDGKRQGLFALAMQSYVAEAGEISLDVAEYIASQWAQLGIEVERFVEDYGGVRNACAEGDNTCRCLRTATYTQTFSHSIGHYRQPIRRLRDLNGAWDLNPKPAPVGCLIFSANPTRRLVKRCIWTGLTTRCIGFSTLAFFRSQRD